MLAIINATLVMRDHLIPEAALFISEGKIQAFGEMRKLQVPADCEILDVEGEFVGPGLIDIHTHCGGKDYFSDNPLPAARHHLEHGTTTVLPALYFNMDQKGFLDGIQVIRKAMGEKEGANMGGLYMEGPYLNPKFGCDRESNPWKGPVKAEDFLPIVEAAWDLTKVWALAPEREGILDFVRAVKEKNPAAVFSVAHSEAAPEEIEALLPYGLRIGTHHTNATGDRVKYPECRGVCVDETVNYNSGIYAELICDSRGIHVDPYMLRLIRKIKGDDRIILISDAFSMDGPVPQGYEGVTDINFDFAGEIAGSKLTLEKACYNMMKHTGASIVQAFQYASYNPSRATGLLDRGEIATGLRADLVVVDYKMNMKKVILKGEVQ
ncbi:MAG: amidohydrolase family protein [Lachnospiraceae bacterium]|nr:amidohydrolase family protein [Lachnospiraceae bacterium]